MKKLLLIGATAVVSVGLVRGICKHLIRKSNENLEKVYEQENSAREKFYSDKLNELKDETK